ncbi:COA8-like protein, partial [Mya arenaria]
KTTHLECHPPEDVARDWIGPPDKVSNIRQLKLHKAENETMAQREYREQQEVTRHWHHQFWEKHNKDFFAQKEVFTQQRLAEKAEKGHDEKITPEELSEFYKKFLDENYKAHIQYN